MSWKKFQISNKNVREDFCGACLTVPLAALGVGVGAYGSGARGKYRKKKTIMLVLGILITVISVAIGIYFLKKCSNCR